MAYLAIGQEYERLTDYEQIMYGAKIHLNSSFEANQQIQKYWKSQFSRLKTDKYQMFLCGNGESVLKVSIPARLLFEPNESELQRQADGMLKPFLRLLRGGEALATVVIACYSDNNGATTYLDKMTLSRANALKDWLTRQGVSSKVWCYGMGNHVPLNNNGNMMEREINRRVSLYLIPNKQMQKLARKKKLI